MLDMSGNLLSWLIRAATLVALLFLQRLDGVSATAGALALIALGIPHGAADHLIFRSRYPGRLTGLRFLLFYVLLIIIYAALWVWLPWLALLLFLGASVFHFGQSYYDPQPRLHGSRPWMLRLCWGAFVLLFPIFYHYGEARPIVESIVGREMELPPGWSLALPFILIAVNAYLVLTGRDRGGRLSPALRRQLLDLLLLSLLYCTTPLLQGFAVYFLLWHSVPALVEQWRYLSRHRLSGGFRDYVWQLVPLSLGAFVTLGLAYWWFSHRSGLVIDPGMFFILVSLITLPHAFLVDRVYR